MVHQAKVDLWLAALLGGVTLLEVALGVAILTGALGGAAGVDPGTPPAVGLILLGSGAFVGLILWGCYRSRYEITETALITRFGPFRFTIPLDAVVGIHPTRNPLSAPAPSLDRLHIDYRHKNGKIRYLLISPRDKEAFVSDLATAAPQLRHVGDGPLRWRAD